MSPDVLDGKYSQMEDITETEDKKRSRYDQKRENPVSFQQSVSSNKLKVGSQILRSNINGTDYLQTPQSVDQGEEETATLGHSRSSNY